MSKLRTINKISEYKEECVALYDNVDGVKTIDAFVNRVENLSKSIKYNTPEKLNRFKGDMLEILSEIFFTAFRNSPDVGIREYEPVSLEEDYGVDALGINVNNDNCVIQVKYRANPLERITYEDLAKTFTAGMLRHNYSLSNDNTVYLFTTSYEITYACDEVFKKKLRFINRNVIAGKIDNNFSFWKDAEDMIAETFEELLK